MKVVLNHLFEGKTLSKEKAKGILINIGKGQYNNSQVAAFLSAYIMRSITIDELEGFRDALLELCLPVDLSDFETIDLCGTGGDEKNTFNISTLTSFVLAGAGFKVAKHGNYGVSSVCGSSNVMEYLGYRFSNDISVLKKQLDIAGICFMHAPLFHPAMRQVAPIRKELGIKTFFNMLGPLVNPSRPKNQMVGVFNLELLRLYKYLFQRTHKNYVILHSLDGYDEISLTANYKIVSNEKEQIIDPLQAGFELFDHALLKGGDSIEEAAKIFINILNGKGTRAQRAIVKINAATAIRCLRPKLTMEETLALATESLYSGKAFNSFKKLIT